MTDEKGSKMKGVIVVQKYKSMFLRSRYSRWWILAGREMCVQDVTLCIQH